MPATARHPELGILRPSRVYLFVGLVAAWVLVWALPDWEWLPWRVAGRACGYLALGGMLVPYAHIVRRWFRHRYLGAMDRWLGWHVAAAYLAFFFLLIHTRARAGGGLTAALQALTWVVMLSGVAGYYGQKVLYASLPSLVPREFGRERLGPQRKQVEDEADKLLEGQSEDDPEGVRRFRALAKGYLKRPFGDWWRHPFRRPDRGLSEEGLLRALEKADDPAQITVLKGLWDLVKQRRQLDREYRLHQLGRAWLLFHGPAAWLLLALVVEHVVVSVWYGGF